MTVSLKPRRGIRPRAGAFATGLFLGGLVFSSALVLVGGRPASAQTIANPNDQPTPATTPSPNGARAAERPTGQVSPPSAIRSSTSVVSSDRKKSSYTNPLDHLPARDRAATGGRGE